MSVKETQGGGPLERTRGPWSVSKQGLTSSPKSCDPFSLFERLTSRQRLREPGAITLFAALEFSVPWVSQLASCRRFPLEVHCVLPAPRGCLYFLHSPSLHCLTQQLCLLLCVSDLCLQPCVGFLGFHITVLSTLPRRDSWNYSGPSWIRQGHLLHLGLGLNTPAKPPYRLVACI